MIRLLPILTILLAGFFAGPAIAQDESPLDPAIVAFWNGDYGKAYEEWLKRADAGDSEAMNNIGILFNKGLGVKADNAKAAVWYGRAAQLGYPNAQFNLANLYYDGGNGIKRDLGLAAAWYRAAADRGHMLSAYYLGGMYLDGKGVEKDELTAMTWIVKAADGGLAEAQFDIGIRLRDGDGVREDPAKAVEYLLKAAEQKHHPAQFALAKLYAEGEGVAESPLDAYVWAFIAAKHLKSDRDRDAAADLRDKMAAKLPEDGIAAANAVIAIRDPAPRSETPAEDALPTAP